MIPFESDGCTGLGHWLWQLIYRKDQPPWCQCCLEHDWAYWNGGTSLDRAKADVDLFRCIVHQGFPWFAILVWLGIRLWAGKWMPFGWTWGWGND